MTRESTKLCESCRGSGVKDTGPKFAGDIDDRDVPYATPAPTCQSCGGRGRVSLGGEKLS